MNSMQLVYVDNVHKSQRRIQGVHVYKGVCRVILTYFLSKYPMKMKLSDENEIIWSHLRPNYFIFIGYLKTSGGEGGLSDSLELPLDWPLKAIEYFVHYAYCLACNLNKRIIIYCFKSSETNI